MLIQIFRSWITKNNSFSNSSHIFNIGHLLICHFHTAWCLNFNLHLRLGLIKQARLTPHLSFSLNQWGGTYSLLVPLSRSLSLSLKTDCCIKTFLHNINERGYEWCQHTCLRMRDFTPCQWHARRENLLQMRRAANSFLFKLLSSNISAPPVKIWRPTDHLLIH